MGGLILIFILVSPGVAFCFQEKEPGIHACPSRAPLAVTAAGEENDGSLCGECPCPEPEDRGYHGAFSAISPTRDTGAVRRCPSVFPKHGLGPVLSSLSDTLILSRPPPPAPGRSWRGAGASRHESKNLTRRENP